MGRKNEGESQSQDLENGLSVIITFLTIAGFLYFDPSHLGNLILSYVLTFLFLLIGIIGLGVELNKLANGNSDKLGFSDLFLGMGMGTCWIIIYYFREGSLSNLVFLPLLLISIYGISKGLIKILKNLFSSESQFIFKLPLVIFQFTAFIAAIFTILNILKLI